MKPKRRFVYGYSHVYGWTVYDTERGYIPAYDACCDLLPRISENVAESPVLLPNEVAAMRLCLKLNRALTKRV